MDHARGDATAQAPTPPSIILGSDLVYTMAALPLLASTIHRLLLPTRGEAILVQDDDCVPSGKGRLSRQQPRCVGR